MRASAGTAAFLLAAVASATEPLPTARSYRVDRAMREAAAALEAGDCAAANSAAARATALATESVPTHELALRVASGCDDAVVAASAADALDRLSALSPRTLDLAAAAALRSGDRERARARWQRLAELAPSSPDGPFGLARLAWTGAAPDDAAKALREARRRGGDLAGCLLRPGWERLRDDAALQALLASLLAERAP